MENLINRKLSMWLIATLIACSLFCGIICCTSSASADSVEFESEFKIAHITDIHYFPYSDCYHGEVNTPEYLATEFYKSIASDTKLINQAGTLLSATILSIIQEMPDYLVVSGDITRDGELRAHYDVANALRFLQNQVRQNGKPNFQVLVVPGNHDLYNSNASIYDEDGVKIMLESNRTTNEAFSIIYNGLGYPALSEEDLGLTSIGTSMLDYLNNVTTYSYTSKYIESTLASDLDFTYYSNEIGFSTEADPAYGCLSYIATNNSKCITFAMMDSTIREESEDSNLYWEHLTGGRITTAALEWLEENTVGARNEQHTIIGVAHHNLLPHYTLEENYTKDFTLYNWEDTANYFSDDIGIRYVFTGHMHANDVTHYTTYEGNVIYDMETGSIVSLNSPTRFTTFKREIVDEKLTEDIYTANVSINDLNGISSTFIDDSEQSSCLFEGEDYDSMVDYISSDIYDLMVQRLLDSFISDGLAQTLKDLINGLDINGIFDNMEITALKAFKKEARGLVLFANYFIDDIFFNFDYNIGDISATSLTDFIRKLLNSSEVLDIVVYQEGEEVYTLQQIVIWAYKCHIAGNEPAILDGETALSRAAIKTIESLKNGRIIEIFLNGLLQPLLFADNSLIYQIINHKVDLTECWADADLQALIYIVFGKAEDSPDVFASKSFCLNDILGQGIVDFVLKIVSTMLPSQVGEALDGDVVEWAKNFINSYMTESLFTSIGGILGDSVLSFATDETPDGTTYIFNSNAVLSSNQYLHLSNGIAGYGNYTYSGVPLTLAQNPPTIADGRLPSILTSTFGDIASSSQNFVWYTNYTVGAKFEYRTQGTTEWIQAEVSTLTKPYAYPLIDAGLFSTTTATTYKDTDGNKVEYTLANREEALTSSVKFINRHSVSLTGLVPNTTYEYRVYGTYGESEFCLQDYIVNEANKFYSFKTALAQGDDTEFTMLAISDLQGTIESSYYAALNAITAAKGVSNYSFIANCGDVVDNGANIKQWGYAQNILTSVFGNTSTVIAAGNHDDSDNALTSYYNFGNIGNPDSQNTANGVYFSFTYGSTHFVVLNTNDYGSLEYNKQQTWLKADLESSTSTYNVVLMHKSIYSVGSHNSDADIVAMRTDLTKIFYDFGVDLVLQGHDHTYSTTELLDGEGNVISKLKTSKNGIF